MKQPKKILVLSSSEYRLMLHGLIHFRNKLIAQGRYPDAISEPGGATMDKIAEQLKAYIDAHPFDPGDSDCETVLDLLYQAYAESHESDPLESSEGFKELEDFLCILPLVDNNDAHI